MIIISSSPTKEGKEEIAYNSYLKKNLFLKIETTGKITEKIMALKTFNVWVVGSDCYGSDNESDAPETYTTTVGKPPVPKQYYSNIYSSLQMETKDVCKHPVDEINAKRARVKAVEEHIKNCLGYRDLRQNNDD